MSKAVIIRATKVEGLATGNPLSVETLSLSSVSQANANAQTAAVGEFWSITVDSPLGVWATFGVTPVAVPGAGWYLTAGRTYEFAATAGDKVALIEQSATELARDGA